jgi:hypothetical protein
MIEKFRYFLLFALSAFFNLKGFSQAVGTPYFVPTGGSSSLTSVTFIYTGVNQEWVVPFGNTNIGNVNTSGHGKITI